MAAACKQAGLSRDKKQQSNAGMPVMAMAWEGLLLLLMMPIQHLMALAITLVAGRAVKAACKHGSFAGLFVLVFTACRIYSVGARIPTGRYQ